MESARTSYMPPVDQLLTYGEGENSLPENWPNYLELGLGPQHIPDLIRMATDEELNWADSESLEVWAPLHAWRALGQLRAEAAIEPLLLLFETMQESDWVTEELPEVFGMIGPAALPALATCITDISSDEEVLISAISCVDKIGTRWPEARSACVELLMEQLELFAENDPEVNSFLVLALVELHAREAAPLIERAYAARCVDLLLMGDWDDVQVEFGLLSAEELKQQRSRMLPEAPSPSPAHQTIHTQVSTRENRQREAGQKKAKNKMVKESRKKNRKR